VSIPAFETTGNLPVGVYAVTLREAIDHFGTASP
jgi:hypothetical protein